MKTTETNPYLSSQVRFDKMMSNYNKFGNLVIGVDFDFTLNDPITDKTYLDIVELIKRMMKHNFKICIWTANEDREFVEKIWNDFNLRWDFYNYSPINPSSIKPHFNILLDDSAGLNEATELVQRIMSCIESRQN